MKSAETPLDIRQRAVRRLAATKAAELMSNAGGSASIYAGAGLERCLRDVHTAGQHVVLVPSNYELVGQALLGQDMRGTILLAMDGRGGSYAEGKGNFSSK